MHFQKRILNHFFPTILLCLLTIISISQAYAKLLITPTRVEFSDRERSAKVSLVNTGNKITTYKIFWREQYQDQEGQYIPFKIGERDFPIASHMLRYSPRQVTLKPGERQHIRLALRRSKDLSEGEYRSHLVFQAQPDKARIRQSKGIQMHMNLAFAIPVIVREGQIDVKAAISKVDLIKRVQNGKVHTGAYIDLERQGKFSTFANIKVYWKGISKQTERLIAEQENIAVYPENKIKRIVLGFKDHNTSPGTMRIVYEGAEEFEGQLFSEKTITVNQNSYRLEENYKK